MIFLDYATKTVMCHRGVVHVSFNLPLGVGPSVLCQMEGVVHVFSIHHSSFKC